MDNPFDEILEKLPKDAQELVMDALKDLFKDELTRANEIASKHYIKAMEIMNIAEVPHQLGINEMYEVAAIGMISAMIHDDLNRERVIKLMTNKVGNLYDATNKKIKELRASNKKFTV